MQFAVKFATTYLVSNFILSHCLLILEWLFKK